MNKSGEWKPLDICGSALTLQQMAWNCEVEGEWMHNSETANGFKNSLSQFSHFASICLTLIRPFHFEYFAAPKPKMWRLLLWNQKNLYTIFPEALPGFGKAD